MIVFPLAKAASTAIIGISSIKVGIISPSITVPCKLEEETVRSATGSPETSLSFENSIFPPISLMTVIMPALVGFMFTFRKVISELGTIRPAAKKYAAEEMSPGTFISCPVRVGFGFILAVN